MKVRRLVGVGVPLILVLFSLLLHCTTAQTLTGFTLFDAENDVDVRALVNDDVIDLHDGELQNIPLTIRANVNGTIDSVTFDWNDGETIRLEGTPPYFLAGHTAGDAYEVNTLRELGRHTLTATAQKNGQSVSELTISFRVIDSSLESFPTTTPLSIYDVEAYEHSAYGEINGELKLWHKITLGFTGQPTGERNNIFNPFRDYKLDVTFVHTESGANYTIPGFYAGDGDAANTGAGAGSTWLCHFRPDKIGEWTWTARFWQGFWAAVTNETMAVGADFFDNRTGSFVVGETDKQLPDLRARGRLSYVPGMHHYQFQGDKTFFLKVGADSPENFLAYWDFDDTPNNNNLTKDWAPHIRDYVTGNPTWMGGKGQGIIGAINYLSAQGVNAISFLTMNIQGDDENVFPFLTDSSDDLDRYDVSKLAQWDIVMDHAESQGMFLHFKTQETENDDFLERNGDNSFFSLQRKLYYRELVARFGHHLALNWNLGEENTNSDEQRRAFANYIKSIDPYQHPIVLHTFRGGQQSNYAPLLGFEHLDGVSLQTGLNSGFNQTLGWVTRSAATGHSWVVTFDEQSPSTDGVVPDDVDPQHDRIRKFVLWANIMAGGAGVEYYFGYNYDNSDLTAQDFRSRQAMWDQSRYALNFFQTHQVPFWTMTNANQLVSVRSSRNGKNSTAAAWCLRNRDAASQSFFVIYLPNGGGSTVDLDLTDVDVGASYSVLWYDPVVGGNLQNGSVTTVKSWSRALQGSVGSVTGNAVKTLGDAPYASAGGDWVILLRCEGDCQTAATSAVVDIAATSAPETAAPSSSPEIGTSPMAEVTLEPAPTIKPILAPVAAPIAMTSETPYETESLASIVPAASFESSGDGARCKCLVVSFLLIAGLGALQLSW